MPATTCVQTECSTALPNMYTFIHKNSQLTCFNDILDLWLSNMLSKMSCKTLLEQKLLLAIPTQPNPFKGLRNLSIVTTDPNPPPRFLSTRKISHRLETLASHFATMDLQRGRDSRAPT